MRGFEEAVTKIIIRVLSFGCGETYSESWSPFVNKTIVCGEKGFLCRSCRNRIMMILKKGDKDETGSNIRK
jgi:hypothetical protein